MSVKANLRKLRKKYELQQSLLPICIDEGCQKYVLFELNMDGKTVYVVRGNRNAEYHEEVARKIINIYDDNNIDYCIIGGGRIQNDTHSIEVYGESYGFPWKNGEFKHFVTTEVLKKQYPDKTVTFRNRGY